MSYHASEGNNNGAKKSKITIKNTARINRCEQENLKIQNGLSCREEKVLSLENNQHGEEGAL